MIAEIPPDVFEIPQSALWTLGGAILGCLISGFAGYRWGLKAQRFGAKLKARNEALAIIDQITVDASNMFGILGLFQNTKGSIKGAIFAFTSQLNDEMRRETEESWKKYAELYFDGHWDISLPNSQQNISAFENDQKKMLEALKSLRDCVQNY